MTDFKFTSDTDKLALLAKVLHNAEGKVLNCCLSVDRSVERPHLPACLWGEAVKSGIVDIELAYTLRDFHDFADYFQTTLGVTHDIRYDLADTNGTKWANNVRNYLLNNGVHLPDMAKYGAGDVKTYVSDDYCIGEQ